MEGCWAPPGFRVFGVVSSVGLGVLDSGFVVEGWGDWFRVCGGRCGAWGVPFGHYGLGFGVCCLVRAQGLAVGLSCPLVVCGGFLAS